MNVEVHESHSCWIGIGRVGLGRVGLGRVRIGRARIGRVRIGRVRIGRFRIGRFRIGRVRIGRVRIGRVRISRVETWISFSSIRSNFKIVQFSDLDRTWYFFYLKFWQSFLVSQESPSSSPVPDDPFESLNFLQLASSKKWLGLMIKFETFILI